MGSVPSISLQPLAGAQALVYSKGISKTEWDEMLTATKNTVKASMEKSVLRWAVLPQTYRARETKQPQCTQQDCGAGPPGDSIRAQEPTHMPMAGRG